MRSVKKHERDPDVNDKEHALEDLFQQTEAVFAQGIRKTWTLE